MCVKVIACPRLATQFAHRPAPLFQSIPCSESRKLAAQVGYCTPVNISSHLKNACASPSLAPVFEPSPCIAQLDRQRGNFQLKETALAAALVRASGLDKSHADANNALNWRQHTAKTAGNFAKTMEEVWRLCRPTLR